MKKKNIFANEKIQLVIVFILLFITCSNFYYCDVNSNIRQGINFWKALFSGDFFHYYSINAISVEAGEMIHYANYDMVMNFFMGIMGLPIYIIECIFKINVQDYLWGRILGKSIYPIAIMLAGDFFRITVRELLEGIKAKSEYTEKCMKLASNAAFMFMTSTLVISSTCVITQADIFGIIFIILTFRYLFRQDIKRFMLFFIIAVQCKNFALFMFIPLVMLIEKNLFKMGAMLLSPLVITKLIELPFTIIDPAGTVIKKPRLWSMFGTMMDVKVELMGVEIPILFLLYGTVCLFAYMKNKPENLEKFTLARTYLFYALLAMSAFFFSMRTYAYWIIYFAPILTFMFVIRNVTSDDKDENADFSSHLFKNYFLECFASFSIIAGFMVKYYSEYYVDNVAPMLAGALFPTTKVPDTMFDQYDFYEFVTNPVYYNMWTVSYAVFILYCLYLIVAEYKRINSMSSSDALLEKVILENVPSKMLGIEYRGWLWIRAIAAFVFCNLGVILYILQR